MGALRAAQFEYDNREPDSDEMDCPWCGLQCTSQHQLIRHVSKCADNPGVDPEQEDYA